MGILHFDKGFEEMRGLVTQTFGGKNIHDREMSGNEECACLFAIQLFTQRKSQYKGGTFRH